MKKKRLIIGLIIIIVLAMVVPYDISIYSDGGTHEYKALTYKVLKWSHFYGDGQCYEKTHIYFGNDISKDIDELFEKYNYSKDAQ